MGRIGLDITVIFSQLNTILALFQLAKKHNIDIENEEIFNLIGSFSLHKENRTAVLQLDQDIRQILQHLREITQDKIPYDLIRQEADKLAEDNKKKAGFITTGGEED